MQQQAAQQPVPTTPPPPPPPSAPPPPAQAQPDRTYAVLLHISALSGLIISPIGFLLGPLIMWLLKKDEDPFIHQTGRRAVNFQITFLIVYAVLLIVAFVVFFSTTGSFWFSAMPPDPFMFSGFAAAFVLLALGGLVLVILNVVFSIIAALRANEGIVYDYPMAIGFLK